MRTLLCITIGAALICSIVFADHKGTKDKHDHKDDHKKEDDHHHHEHRAICPRLVKSNEDFAFGLYKQIADDHPDDNIVISPVSISLSLAFLSLGAKARTHDQILDGIGLNSSETTEKNILDDFHRLLEVLNDNDRELHLDSGNGLFISNKWKILEDFLNKAKNFNSEAFNVDFEQDEEAKKQINTFVEQKTNGKIVDVLSTVNRKAAFIAINFIYFRAKWEKPFDEQDTAEGDFHVNENVTVKVPFMSKINYYKMAVVDDATIVSLPYKGNASAIFILPKEGKTKQVESNLHDIMRKWKASARTTFVSLKLPKFSASSSFDLKELLPKFGITDLFTNSADLSGITGAPELKISKALHKTLINVHEKGTEAAGVTVMEGIPMMLPLDVAFKHPFIFIIQDHNANHALFMGKVADPTK